MKMKCPFQFLNFNTFSRKIKWKNMLGRNSIYVYQNNFEYNRFKYIGNLLGLSGILILSYMDSTKSDDTKKDQHKLMEHDIINEKYSKCLEGFKSILRKDQISIDEDERAIRGKPWNSYHKCSRNPNIIVFPDTTNDVSNIVKICSKYSIPIIPYGGGTSIEGQTLGK